MKITAVFLVTVFVAISAILVAILLGGFVIQTLWGWFIVTTFGLKSLTIAQAIGLSLVTHYLTYNSSTDSSEDVKNSVIRTACIPIISLVVGYIVHFFV